MTTNTATQSRIDALMAQWHANTLEVLFRYGEPGLSDKDYSLLISHALNRSFMVLSGNALPHSKLDPTDLTPYKPEEAEAIFAFVRQQVENMFPTLIARILQVNPQELEKGWKKQTSMFDGYPCNVPPLLTNIIPEGPLQPRLAGKSVPAFGAILGPDQRWTDEQIWAFFSGLKVSEVERYPLNSLIRVYMVLHELGHLLQRSLGEGTEKVYDRKWQIECDAENFVSTLFKVHADNLAGDNPGMAQKLIETYLASQKVRALNGYLAAASTHLLVFGGPEGGVYPKLIGQAEFDSSILTVEENKARLAILLALRELQMRALGKLEGMPITASSEKLHLRFMSEYEQLINPAAFQLPSHTLSSRIKRWHDSVENPKKLNSLQEIYQDITCPYTRYVAGEVWQGAEILCPSRMGLIAAPKSATLGVPTFINLFDIRNQ